MHKFVFFQHAAQRSASAASGSCTKSRPVRSGIAFYFDHCIKDITLKLNSMKSEVKLRKKSFTVAEQAIH